MWCNFWTFFVCSVFLKQSCQTQFDGSAMKATVRDKDEKALLTHPENCPTTKKKRVERNCRAYMRKMARKTGISKSSANWIARKECNFKYKIQNSQRVADQRWDEIVFTDEKLGGASAQLSKWQVLVRYGSRHIRHRRTLAVSDGLMQNLRQRQDTPYFLLTKGLILTKIFTATYSKPGYFRESAGPWL